MADPVKGFRLAARGEASGARDLAEREEIEPGKNAAVSTLLHELRAPLASMLGFTELLLQREYSPEKQREFLGIVHAESKRLSELINNFLDLQRIASGRQAWSLETRDIAPLLRECVADFESSGRQPTFLVEAPESLPAVVIDAARLRQVIGHLLSNAVTYSPEGGAIRLGARVEQERLLLWISDQGIGIPPEDVPRLFRRFFRAENAVRRGIRGSGLGLALCREIMRHLGGEIWAESEPGRGATFHLALPLATREETSGPAPQNVFR